MNRDFPKFIPKVSVTSDVLTEYLNKVSQIRDSICITAPQLGMQYRIITVNGSEGSFTFVNPEIEVLESSFQFINREWDYMDGKVGSGKLRNVIRNSSIKVISDNHQLPIEFKPVNLFLDEEGMPSQTWKSREDFLNDSGVIYSTLIQRTVDQINGMSIKHPARSYNIQRTNVSKQGRNDRVMLKSNTGDMVFVKSKFKDKYIQNGYQLI